MHLNGDELIAQFQKDWPTEAELSRLRLLVAKQQQEIERLTAAQPYRPPRGLPGLEETRNDLTGP